MKGIVLAGGSGSRLYPLTLALSKQLVPVYDKPMIYYPLSSLMLAGIRDILIITTPRDKNVFQELLGDGTQLGCRFEYAVQEEPQGLAQAFVVGADFIGQDHVALILGDNIFYGAGLAERLQHAARTVRGGLIFAYQVREPERYGVVAFDRDQKAISLQEKPADPPSNWAVPGIYFYDERVVSIASQLEPSLRGEYEITDVNRAYLEEGELEVAPLGRGFAWLDTGTFSSLMQAGQFVQVVEERQGLKIGCIEEVAYRMGFIGGEQLEQLAQPLLKSGYGQYLMNILR